MNYKIKETLATQLTEKLLFEDMFYFVVFLFCFIL